MTPPDTGHPATLLGSATKVRLPGREADGQAGKRAERKADKETDMGVDRETARKANKQIHRRRLTERHTVR